MSTLTIPESTSPFSSNAAIRVPVTRPRPRHIRPTSYSHKRLFHHEPYPLSTSSSPYPMQTASSEILPISPTKEPRPSRHGSPAFYLSLYFLLNLALTLSNKAVLIRFSFPYTLTAIHAFCASVGAWTIESSSAWRGSRSRLKSKGSVKLGLKEYIVLLAFSILYSLNIVVSNASLGLVTVPFHQIVRASAPIFTILFSASLLGVYCTRAKLIALIPVILGVGFATYGDYHFTASGFLLTLLGTVLAALKTIFTNVLQSSPANSPLVSTSSKHESPPAPGPWHEPPFRPGVNFPSTLIPRLNPAFLPRLSLPPLTLLSLMSPLACIQCVLYAQLSGELARIGARMRGAWVYAPHEHIPSSTATGEGFEKDGEMPMLFLLLINGVLAFGLNVVSFTAGGRVGSVSMGVAANIKQVLTILAAVTVFDLTITRTNALGIGLTLLGGMGYACVS